MTTINLILMVAVTAAVMFAVRYAPFALFGGNRQVPSIVKFLGEMLPPAVMAILVVYCVKDVDYADINSILPQLISILLVVILHVWKRNNLLSIGGGTVCYMLLIHYVFI